MFLIKKTFIQLILAQLQTATSKAPIAKYLLFSYTEVELQT